MRLLGPVRCHRAYYYCGRRGQGPCPRDRAVGLTDRRLTPAAQQLVSLAGAWGDGFGEAAEEILPRLSGLRLSGSTARRTTGGAGQRAGACRAGGQAFGPRATRDWHTAARGRRCAWVGIGAVCAPQQGAGGAAAPGRLPHVAPAYNPRPAPPETAGEPAGASGRRPRAQARYLAGLYELDELGPQLRRQGARVGMGAADLWLGLADGANGLEDFVGANFARPDVVPIPDFWHPAAGRGGWPGCCTPATGRRPGTRPGGGATR